MSLPDYWIERPSFRATRATEAHGRDPNDNVRLQGSQSDRAELKGNDCWLVIAAQLEEGLRTRLSTFLADCSRLLALAESARAAAFPDAAERVADIALQEARA